jgi:excisionase family DNA binding protein
VIIKNTGEECRAMAEPATPTAAAARRTITVAEAAAQLGVSLPSVYAAMKRGDLPAVRVGARWLVPKAPFEALLRGGAAPRPAEPTRPDRPAA